MRRVKFRQVMRWQKYEEGNIEKVKLLEIFVDGGKL